MTAVDAAKPGRTLAPGKEAKARSGVPGVDDEPSPRATSQARPASRDAPAVKRAPKKPARKPPAPKAAKAAKPAKATKAPKEKKGGGDA